MRFAVAKLDELIGEIEAGRVVLLETVGELGREFVFKFLQTAEKDGEEVFIFMSSFQFLLPSATPGRRLAASSFWTP